LWQQRGQVRGDKLAKPVKNWFSFLLWLKREKTLLTSSQGKGYRAVPAPYRKPRTANGLACQ
jgi:hypothetical protein